MTEDAYDFSVMAPFGSGRKRRVTLLFKLVEFTEEGDLLAEVLDALGAALRRVRLSGPHPFYRKRPRRMAGK